MKKYSKGQLRTLADFCNNLSLVWLSAGVVAPYFSATDLSKRLSFTLMGFLGAYIFISFSLILSKELD